ncbi:MAG TPA: 30S ribosomal protein S9 [Candidatus Hydrogenedentes bacterium]|nr:30S ribosomal protein S9 [Candidatus Hydrogenedentota bacterium]HIJ75067.1 30S ribosomal protein S9 [Candidatus Hydrogenedentota bacterium]
MITQFDVTAFVEYTKASREAMKAASALRLGIAWTLVAFDEKYRTPLRRAGFLTRDPRQVQRKIYGRPGARKRFQFPKH